jgi:hypothetical protein
VQQDSQAERLHRRHQSSTGARSRLRAAPRGAHAEACCAGVLRGLGGIDNAADIGERLVFDTGVVARRLRTVAAIFRAAAGLDRHQRRQLDGVGRVMRAMDVLRMQQQVGEGQREQRLDCVDVDRSGRCLFEDRDGSAHRRSLRGPPPRVSSLIPTADGHCARNRGNSASPPVEWRVQRRTRDCNANGMNGLSHAVKLCRAEI